MSEGMRDTWEEFQQNTRYYRSFLTPHRGDSVRIARQFTTPIDLLFIDGDHAYDSCHADVQSWVPLLKPGGMLIMHDYAWAEGVRRVVQEDIVPLSCHQGRSMQNIYWIRMEKS
jgi:predicted O-methyltransferase YrrM